MSECPLYLPRMTNVGFMQAGSDDTRYGAEIVWPKNASLL